MSYPNLSSIMLPALENELHRVVNSADEPNLDGFHQMLAYHMGWEGNDAGPAASGKRIRPLLLLLTNASSGGEWERALPAAAAVELVHNFSLIHDDIQDNSPLRRGRPTVWKKWGVPLALNAGDAMLTLAHLSMLRLDDTCESKITLAAELILQQTCLELTKGQHRDISYEGRRELSLDNYWPMVIGKTAALLSACTSLGALVAGATPERVNHFRDFGQNLGIAFQALDDLLGIWGDAALTGKSADSDLISGKKSLPVLYALTLNGPFAERWRRGSILQDEVRQLSHQMEIEGARDYTQHMASCYTEQALQALYKAHPTGNAGDELAALADQLLKRQL